MNFTNSPYEPFMKQPTYHRPPGTHPGPQGIGVRGVSLLAGPAVRDLLPGLSAEPGRARRGEVKVWTSGSSPARSGRRSGPWW